MNILIISGGSGSQKLQEGLFAETNNLPKVLINAYDNGKSTGFVRDLYGILGPSDIRKNHNHQFSLFHPLHKNKELIDLLEKRIDLNVTIESKKNILKSIDNTKAYIYSKYIVKSAISNFFNLLLSLKYTKNILDFSLFNAVYGQLMYEIGTKQAANLISEAVFCMPNNLVLNNWDNFYIYGITQSRKKLAEENIVEWNSETDPIIDLQFKDGNKNQCEPPRLCKDAQIAIQEADTVIISSGTLWSSILPTMWSKQFKETIISWLLKDSYRRVFLVMNGSQDSDMKGKGSHDILELIEKFIPSNRITVLYSASTLDSSMKISQEDRLRFKDYAIEADIFDVKTNKHKPNELAKIILNNL